MYVVFIHFLKFGQGIKHFAVALLLGIVMWTFFIEATSQGMQAIVSRGDLLRKINFPKYILVISGTISALINFILNLVVVLIFMLVDGVDLHWAALLFPVTMAILFAFSLATAFFLAAVNVKFRDIGHIWEVLLQGLFYATPIIYPLQTVMNYNDFAAHVLMLNPIAVIFQDARAQLVGPENVTTAAQLFENPIYLAIPYVIIVVVIISATWYFRKSQAKFAEFV
jgi:ABC-2 type transport system permease protein